ncbi:KA1 domain/Ssp2 C-terminal domain-containing protein, partial [Chytridium lagenaria]
RTVRYSFNPSLTSTLSPSQVFQDVHRVLLADIDGYDHGESSAVDFEVEVCKIWLLKLHGVRIKRISGNALMFKDVYSNVCELLNI